MSSHRGPGRPPLHGVRMTQDAVGLTEEQWATLRSLGGGQKSVGLRWLLENEEVQRVIAVELAQVSNLKEEHGFRS